MKTLAGLLAKVKGLKEEGLNGHMWTGGYKLPSPCITDTAADDILFIDEIIGAGEIAIADERASEPTAHELARLAHDIYVAGKLSNKAGRIHIHVGDGESRLGILNEAIEKHAVRPEWFYLTHITRSEELMRDAVTLAKNGAFVDMDTVDEDLAVCLKSYIDNSGWLEQLTISTDASITSPHNLLSQLRDCVLNGGFPISTVLPLVTSNTARALKLEIKGRLAPGLIADVLVLTKKELELVEVIVNGKRLFRDGKIDFTEKFLRDSNREIVLKGQKQPADTPEAEHRLIPTQKPEGGPEMGGDNGSGANGAGSANSFDAYACEGRKMNAR
jgi:beta-aspartyl-dipeptidase (metallo-type)